MRHGHDIYEVDGEIVGRQSPSDTRAIDILAITKDRKELLVVELKKGPASDVLVAQIQRYIGYVLGELAEDGQSVKGVIIDWSEGLRIKRDLQVANNMDFYRYEVSFKFNKEQIWVVNMTTTNSPNNNLSPWKPGQSGNPSGRPRGTRDLAG